MLGHLFATWALYLFAKGQSGFGRRELWLLALLCCLGLFVEQLLVAVPVTLAVTLLLRNRRRFADFAVAGLAIAALLALAIATRLVGGPHAPPSVLAFQRQMDAAQRTGELWALFAQRGVLMLVLPVVVQLLVPRKRSQPARDLLGCLVRVGVDLIEQPGSPGPRSRARPVHWHSNLWHSDLINS